MQFVAASAKVAGHFSAEEGKDFVEMVGRRNARVDHDFQLRIDLAAFFEESEREARAYAERILLINATPRKGQLNFLPGRTLARNVREKYGPRKNFCGAFFVLARDAQRKGRPGLFFVAQF